jgi:hypothetical protein
MTPLAAAQRDFMSGAAIVAGSSFVRTAKT